MNEARTLTDVSTDYAEAMKSFFARFSSAIGSHRSAPSVGPRAAAQYRAEPNCHWSETGMYLRFRISRWSWFQLGHQLCLFAGTGKKTHLRKRILEVSVFVGRGKRDPDLFEARRVLAVSQEPIGLQGQGKRLPGCARSRTLECSAPRVKGPPAEN